MSKRSEIEQKVLTKQNRIAQIADKYPDKAMLSLAHHIDLEWLYIAYCRTRKDGAAGIDDVTAEQYTMNLRENLISLLNRFKSGSYRAPAVRRVYIPKGNGETRPLGIPTFEDKILQRAVTMALEPVFEQDFLPCSYGFRKGKSAILALKDFRKRAMAMKGGWVIDLDIRKYFDNIDHSKLRDIFKQRVCDGVITRIVGKWLKAGVMEEEQVFYNDAGTPQGGVISPLLSNIYLHCVLDNWFENEVKPKLSSQAELFRFADDSIIIFKQEKDARRVLRVLPKRFEKFGLSLHPDKTRLVKFVSPYLSKTDNDGPDSFQFLGFTIYWGISRNKKWLIKCKTAKDRLARSIKKINDWMKEFRHEKLKEQYPILVSKLRGHYIYYGISFNFKALNSFYYQCVRLWRKWLCRRSRENRLDWSRYKDLLAHYSLPKPKIYHSLWSEPTF